MIFLTSVVKGKRYGCQPKNRGGFPPKSSILIGFSITIHPFWGTIYITLGVGVWKKSKTSSNERRRCTVRILEMKLGCFGLFWPVLPHRKLRVFQNEWLKIRMVSLHMRHKINLHSFKINLHFLPFWVC